jgi:hypothetical protein
MAAPCLSPSVRGGLLMILQVSLALALCVVLQLLASRHNARIDLTATRRFALAPISRQVADGFDRPVRVTAFFNGREPQQQRDMADLLEQFATVAPDFTYTLLDLDRSPAQAQRAGVTGYNTGILEVGQEVVVLRGISQAEVTAALLRLSQSAPRLVCFLSGHGERRAEAQNRFGYSGVAEALRREHFAVRTLGTLTGAGVPAECTIVVLAGPSKDFLPGESDALLAYLRHGGRVLALVDPDAPPSMLALLRQAGIDAPAALVVDEQNRFVGADSFMPQVGRFRDQLFAGKLTAPAVLALARPLLAAEPGPDGVELTALAVTSPESWAAIGVSAPPDTPLRFRSDVDRIGPIPVALMAVFAPATGEHQGVLIAIGDSDLGSNFFLDLLGNRDFLLSTVAVLAEEPALVAVREKTQSSQGLSPIALTDAQSRHIFWAAVIVPPVTCLALGGVFGLRRRRRRGGR